MTSYLASGQLSMCQVTTDDLHLLRKLSAACH